ncbi:glycoside hydrolase family 3 N-terminal domain-containing protein [Staphylococcus pasteuri]|uniref:glycoside hydrolase family 3 protein n=1 Tax=Staphylococcus TaxID=1279 RepID=UPI0002D4484D|nr:MULTISPECIES: glycoside hydrolase family 3 N-terminal domain-containing protein [Staphylococcus]ODB72017.1 glycosyl hydrolase [Staphylococcus sp. AOAB]RQX28172.1 glycoside hydrolase family 3 protein [Staphylococcus warneri]MBM6506246.1 glycoside hydrolase family 3 protein [Staphylococcus pasteuri]MCO0861656.1 glycoside hydrolase family 3 protein [Staphylococcus pasteuri]MCO5359902.1 glycoside hydrolase family 3 protein [Staphylococcus pasteuri]
MVKVDLKSKPYNLNDQQIQWVENTLSELTDEEKIGQLFFNLFFLEDDANFNDNELTNKDILDKYHIGGARFQGGNGQQVQHLLNDLQHNSKIPLLIAANCDSGGNGACKDGTYIASAAQCEAAQDTKVAYNAGYVSGQESSALGVNINFDPCVDILENWRNTIVNTRAYGTNADTVIKYTNAFIEGFNQTKDMITCIKHFPGDGTEERDQHLVLGVNEMTPDEWDQSFRKVYANHIDNGVEMIMSGHIALPHYSKKLNPALNDEDILPATLSKELITDLLKDDLNFNGLVVTDASHMLGMTAAMKREDYVPQAIAAGCDMFLFFNDIEEDFNFMLNGYKNGVITDERLNDAVRRILGLKAKINLHEKQANNTLEKDEKALEVVGCDKHIEMQKEAADLGITLVKNTLNQLPIRPETHKNIRLYVIEGEKNGLYKSDDSLTDNLVSILEKRGFNVTVNDGSTRIKGKTLEYRDEVDAALVFANIVGYAAENNYRIRWSTAMSNEIPWYVHEVPTVFTSLNFTTHLHDATMVKAYINAYHSNQISLETVVDKIMGESDFKGVPNDLVWTNKWQAKL